MPNCIANGPPPCSMPRTDGLSGPSGAAPKGWAGGNAGVTSRGLHTRGRAPTNSRVAELGSGGSERSIGEVERHDVALGRRQRNRCAGLCRAVGVWLAGDCVVTVRHAPRVSHRPKWLISPCEAFLPTRPRRAAITAVIDKDASARCRSQPLRAAPWQCFHLRPLPQVQGSLRPRRASSAA